MTVRAFDLNGLILAADRKYWIAYFYLVVTLHLTITSPTFMWWWLRWLPLVATLKLAWRSETHRQYEALPRWLNPSSRRRLDRHSTSSQPSWELSDQDKASLWLLRNQRNIFIPIYCYFNSGWVAISILLIHVHFSWHQRRRVSKMRTHVILGPLGLDMEIFWAIIVTQLSRHAVRKIFGP